MKRDQIISCLMILLFVSAFLFINPIIGHAQSDQPVVISMKLNGALTPVWRSYLERGIQQAVSLNAELIVIELNTPGGSIELMNNFVQQILASPVPVAVFVSPEGAMAASAGTMIVLAGDFAAMTPGSAIGAASPVGAQGEEIETTEALKTKEILKASIRSMAEWRGLEAIQLAEAAIDDAKAASAQEALNANLIDLIAVDLDDLLTQLDGNTAKRNNQTHPLDLSNFEIVVIPATFIETVLGMLTNPNIVFILLSLGVQAVLIELSHPGGWVAGFFGAIMLSLAVYGLGILPVNWFGLVILVISFFLFILDIKAPTHGALTIAGTATFITGALILFNSSKVPFFSNVSVPLVVGMGVFMGATFFAVVMIAVRAMRTPVVTGRESLVGKTGRAVTEINPTGIVQVAGEQWSAKLLDGEPFVDAGKFVEVVETEGVKLVVRSAFKEEVLKKETSS